MNFDRIFFFFFFAGLLTYMMTLPEMLRAERFMVTTSFMFRQHIIMSTLGFREKHNPNEKDFY